MVKKLKLRDTDVKKPLSNSRHELFCQIYTSESEFFGNGTHSYAQAYDKDVKERKDASACAISANALLKNPMILQRINYLLNSQVGFNDVNTDKQLAFLIMQSADLRVKLAAIREYNQLKGRIKRKLEVSLVDKSDDELNAELAALEREQAEAEILLAQRQGQPVNVGGMPILTKEQKEAMQSQ